DALTIFSGLSKCAKYRTIPFAFATFCGLGERSFIVISLIWLYDLLLENIIITCQCGFLISPSGLTSLSCNGLSIQGTCKSSIISRQSRSEERRVGKECKSRGTARKKQIKREGMKNHAARRYREESYERQR